MNEPIVSILLVDDEQANRDLLAHHLEHKGYSVFQAEGGLQAVSLISSCSYDLVLLDIMMPDIDGIEVLRRIRSTFSLEELPVIMVTAKDKSDDIVEALEVGANDYISKPVDYRLLFVRIEALLARKRAEKTLLEFNQRLEEKSKQQTILLQNALSSLKEEIAKRKIAENTLKIREQKFRDFSEVTSDWFWETDKHHNLSFISMRIIKILGVHPEEAAGKTAWELIGENPETNNFWRKYKSNLDAHLPFRNSRYTFTSPSGKIHYIRVSGKPVYDVDGIFLGYRGTGNDETSEMDNRRRTVEVENLLTGITDNLNCVIFRRVLKPDGKVEYPFVSSGGNKLTELMAEDIHAGGFLALQAIFGDDVDRVQQAMKRSALELTPIHIDYRIVISARDIKWVLFSATPQRLESGDIIWDGVLQDIDERITLEAQLSQAQKLESVGQLAAGIAHEINTPTQYVSDNMHFLKQVFDDLMKLNKSYEHLLEAARAGKMSDNVLTEIEEAVREADLEFIMDETPKALDQIMDGLQKIIVIVSAMKTFSHPGSDNQESININSLIENTLIVSRNEWKYVATLNTDLDPDLPFIMGNQGKLSQVFLNLVINAAHAISGEGGDISAEEGVISIKTCREDNDIVVRISDTGPGVPETIREKIFDPFFTTKEVGKGTGQGLAISHSVIVSEHGGSLILEQTNGEGATFVIRLPLVEKVKQLERV